MCSDIQWINSQLPERRWLLSLQPTLVIILGRTPLSVDERIPISLFPVMSKICHRLGIDLNRSVAFVDVQKTALLAAEIKKAEEGLVEDDHDFAVFDESGVRFPGMQFFEHCIIVGIEAVQRIHSQNGGCGGVSASEDQIKAQAVSKIFERGNEYSLFPLTIRDEHVTEAVMMVLVDLDGFVTDVWKESNDGVLTLKWFAEMIVEMFIEITNSANSSFTSDWE